MSKVDLKRDSEKRLKNKFSRKHKRDAKLSELEKQLEFAESRCGTLKQQLDYIKMLYGYGKSESMEKELPREEGHGDGSNVNHCCYNISRWSQPTECLGKDGDGPEYTKQTISHTNTTSTNSSNKYNSFKSSEEKDESKHIVYNKQKSHMKLLKIKKKNSKKTKRRRKTETTPRFSNVSSQTQCQIWQDPVVEIYKNSAVNADSDIGLDTIFTSKRIKPNEGLSDYKRQKITGKRANKKYDDDMKDKISDEPKSKSCNSFTGKRVTSTVKEEGIQTELTLDANQIIQSKPNEMKELIVESTLKTENSFCEPIKSYCQPTISSKRKQTEKDIYNSLSNLNFRSIPFIAAKSTAPSHNIGVNIQQVLSTIKNRQLVGENLSLTPDNGSRENSLLALLNSKRVVNKVHEFEPISEAGTVVSNSSEAKKRPEPVRSNLSHWKSNSDFTKDKHTREKMPDDNQNPEWNLKVDKLKRVLVFLHEDFTSLSQKYKRLQKKLTKRNITKTDAKGELAHIERELEKKEEEITVVIELYKEVLNMKEDLKKLQDQYITMVSGRSFIFDSLRQSTSTHTQMTNLLRKIQNFQNQLKG